MNFLTDFADQAVALPITAAVFLAFAAGGWWRGALAWIAGIGATFAVVLVLKLFFQACEPVFVPWRMHSPSGHGAAAAVVFGGLVACLTGSRRATGIAAVLAGLVIGFTRVALDQHSVPEVILGGALGLAGALGIARLAGPQPPARKLPAMMAAIIAAILFHGLHLPAEAAIAHASRGLLDMVADCRGQARP